jgi:osomolarity two-component system, sensor histidine kinase NIK1
MPGAYPDAGDPFANHLIALLDVYEHAPVHSSTPVPKWNGPHDWRTNTILKAIDAIALRMHRAETLLTEIDEERECGPDTKKRRSVEFAIAGETVSEPYPTPLYTPLDAAHQGRSRSPFFSPPASSTPSSNGRSNGHSTRSSSNGAPRAPENREHPPTPPTSPEEEIPTPRTGPRHIPLDGIVHKLEPSPSTGMMTQLTSSPEHYVPCPACGHRMRHRDAQALAQNMAGNGSHPVSPSSALDLVVPAGALAAATFTGGPNAVAELNQLKSQIQDVAIVCAAVAKGDLKKRITVQVNSPTMIQLKDALNGMVSASAYEIVIYHAKG